MERDAEVDRSAGAMPRPRSSATSSATMDSAISRSASITFRVDPPVVSASSTTSARSPGRTVNPRRSTIRPSSLFSAKIPRAFNCRATS